jgi:putative ABC transport system permease protein
MKRSRLIFRNLWYYRKPWLAVLAGASISIAVLTGALAVGDSVRYSLQRLTDVRLGNAKFVLQSKEHLFRDSLSIVLSKVTDEVVAPVLLSEGIAVNGEKEKRINRVEVIGIDSHFSGFWDETAMIPGVDEAIISRNTASKLELKPGDEFLLRIRKQGNISLNAPFAADKISSVSLRLKVKMIANDDRMGRFSLKSNQAAPFNIFISLKQLNAALELEGKANILLISGKNSLSGEIKKIDSLLSRVWQPSDAGLILKKVKGTDQFEIRSERIFMDEKVADAVTSSIPGCSGILTYLANSLSSGGRSTPYSFVTAGDDFLYSPLFSTSPSLSKERGAEGVSMPGNREIIINKWLADDLNLGAGDSLNLSYYVMGQFFSLKEESARFIVRSVISMDDPLCDPGLMPDFPGMSEAGNCRDWETATPIDMKKIRDKDEKYWKDFHGTPKAFISLEAGQQLWKNPFGSYTAFRFKAFDQQVKEIERNIMQKLKPAENGLLLIPVYEEGRSAADNSTDFGGLFLGLSFFIIVSGLLLMAIIFSVHAYTRLTETAVISAMGFRKHQIVQILLAEAGIIVIMAGLIGSVAGIGYNRLILLGLNTLWQDSVRTSALQMHIQFQTLLTGAIAGIVMALIVILFVLYRNLKNPLVVLLHGSKISRFLPWKKFPERTSRFPGFFTLVIRNATLNLKRTLGAIALLAIGTFTIIITAANRKTTPDMLTDRQSGTGGFLYWAETTIPIIYDLNTPEGKKQFSMENDFLFRDVKFLQLYRLDGNDASCLNLNRVSQPAIMGINASYFDKVSAFSLQTFDPSVLKGHPWNVLNQPLSGGVIPGFADQTVIKWGLGKAVGDTLVYQDESGKPLRIKLMAGLDNSIFQGNILISDSLFRIYYPSTGGSKVMLIDGPSLKKQEISDGLEQIFRDYGMIVTSASQRLDEFNSVQNTYLSVFMLLGGFGVIIGTFGLGFLLIRNILDRQHELATYLALGFPKSFITRLLVAEHLLILVSGITIGSITGLAAILPSLFSNASGIPFIFLSLTIGIIFLTGFLWIIIPVRSAFKNNTALALKKEF